MSDSLDERRARVEAHLDAALRPEPGLPATLLEAMRHSLPAPASDDHVKLQYASAREYCGDPEEWKGYIDAYRELVDLQKLESRFWKDFESANVWDAQREQVVLEQARNIAQRCRPFLQAHGRRALLARYYPQAEEALDRFEEMFTHGGARLPKYPIRVTGARIAWDTNASLNPCLVVACNKKEVKGRQFRQDPGAHSGRIEVAGDSSFSWSPFDAVELRVAGNGFGGRSLGHVRSTGYAAAAGLLAQQPLDLLPGADPSLSWVQPVCEFECDGVPVEAERFHEHLDERMPRVIRNVRPELAPERNALALWNTHHPACYCLAAALFEDLCHTTRQPEDALAYRARAMVACFRAFRFDRCAALARGLPEEGDATEAMKAALPQGITVRWLRQLGKTAALADRLPTEDGDFQTLARFLLDWQSFLRLEYTARDPTRRQAAAPGELRAWLTALRQRLERDRRDAGAVRDPVLLTFIQEQAERLQPDLQAVDRAL
jgi:hypothetical protein